MAHQKFSLNAEVTNSERLSFFFQFKGLISAAGIYSSYSSAHLRESENKKKIFTLFTEGPVGGGLKTCEEFVQKKRL